MRWQTSSLSALESQVSNDCCDTNKKGQVNISFAIEPIPMREGGHQIKVTPGITSKNPKYDSGVELFFVVTDEENTPVALETENPRQIQMFKDLEAKQKGKS